MKLQMLTISHPKASLADLERLTGLDPLQIGRWLNQPIPRLNG